MEPMSAPCKREARQDGGACFQFGACGYGGEHSYGYDRLRPIETRDHQSCDGDQPRIGPVKLFWRQRCEIAGEVKPDLLDQFIGSFGDALCKSTVSHFVACVKEGVVDARGDTRLLVLE